MYESFEEWDYKLAKFNIIGFRPVPSSPWRPTLHCVIHPGTRLVHMQGDEDPNIFRCCECGGIGYKQDEGLADEQIHSKFGPSSNKTKIVQPKRKKKYYDDNGTEINDPTLIQDIKQGKTVVYYNEQKSGEDKPHVVRKLL